MHKTEYTNKLNRRSQASKDFQGTNRLSDLSSSKHMTDLTSKADHTHNVMRSTIHTQMKSQTTS